MASVSVVGQHRLDSEPPLFAFKLTSARKKITPQRKASREKMMFRRSSRGSVESTAAGGEPTPPRVGPEPGAEAALRAAEGCRAACHPRSQDRHRAEGNADCDRTSVSGTEEKRSGHSVVCNCDSSGRRSGVSIMLLNGDAHNGAPPQHGRRECRSSGHHSVSSPSSASPSAAVVSSGLPLERVTQGKSGVVRLSRQEPFRLEAWSIFTQEGDPRVKTETGEGHRFEAKPVTQDWCDACSCKITTRAVKCQSEYSLLYYCFHVQYIVHSTAHISTVSTVSTPTLTVLERSVKTKAGKTSTKTKSELKNILPTITLIHRVMV